MAPETPTGRQDVAKLGSSDRELDILHNEDRRNSASKNNSTNDFRCDQSFTFSPDSLKQSPSQSLLAPPNFYNPERRLSTSSCDSSTSQSSKRCLRRNSSSRLSDFDDTNEVTLLSFAKAVHRSYKKLREVFRKPFRLLFVASLRKPNIVCEAEVMEQAIWIVTDYIVNRLSSRQLMSKKISLSPPEWCGSDYIISAGNALESMYPRVYSNVSRKMCVTMSSQKIVRITLSSVLDVLFENGITWGKVVSLFAVSGLFAEDCVIQGHADYVQDVVDVVTDFIAAHMLPWLVSQGGWDAFPMQESDQDSKLSKLRLLGLVAATAAFAMSTSAILYLR